MLGDQINNTFYIPRHLLVVVRWTLQRVCVSPVEVVVSIILVRESDRQWNVLETLSYVNLTMVASSNK